MGMSPTAYLQYADRGNRVGAAYGRDATSLPSPDRHGKQCFEPNTLVSHASFAFNDYYKKHGATVEACNFGGFGIWTLTMVNASISESFKNIAEAWGSLEAVGENTLQGQSCEKVAILISTEQGETIDKLVEFTAGKEKFLIRVSELTLLNHDRVQKASSTKKNAIDAAAMSVSHVSSSESSLVSDRKNTSFTGGKPMDSEEAFKAVFNDKFNGDCDPIVEEGRCVGELDILGSREALNSGHNAFENHEFFLEQRNNKQNASGGAELSWARVVKGRCPNQENTEMLVINEGVKVGLHGKLDSDELANMIVHENVNGRVVLQGDSKTIEDMRLMGFKNHELSTTKFSEDELNVEMIEGQDVIDQNWEKISWEAKVDALNRVVRSGEIENNVEIEGVAIGSMLDLSKLRWVDH
ncbi:hypothetical protein V6N12_048429 [Hibiscus sabdariffa]|uniref:X8 domain-containing protein n=1 Tax=Hibiscus sabdariffa TaxID=183260 RepID=A0ABR2EH74_9ROSI